MSGALALAATTGTAAASAIPTSEPAEISAKKAMSDDVADSLFEELASDGLLSHPSADTLPSAPHTERAGEGVLTVEADSGSQTAFIKQLADGKLEVNTGGTPVDPYAIVRPDDGPSAIYMPDPEGGFMRKELSTLVSPDDVQADVTTDATCDGCYCTTNNNCWLKTYRTVCQSTEDGECVSTSDCGCNLS